MYTCIYNIEELSHHVIFANNIYIYIYVYISHTELSHHDILTPIHPHQHHVPSSIPQPAAAQAVYVYGYVYTQTDIRAATLRSKWQTTSRISPCMLHSQPVSYPAQAHTRIYMYAHKSLMSISTPPPARPPPLSPDQVQAHTRIYI